ncbi:MAG: DUF507 family protein [Bdellovibrionales bacterium]|nr:DUF507 family protein [Bdellovibrionales bacterium]
MSWTEHHTHWFAKKLVKDFENNKGIQLVKDEEAVVQEISLILSRDLDKEKELDQEVTRLLDELEQAQPGGFDRGKMRPMLKRKLAEKKGIIL